MYKLTITYILEFQNSVVNQKNQKNEVYLIWETGVMTEPVSNHSRQAGFFFGDHTGMDVFTLDIRAFQWPIGPRVTKA